MKNSALRVSATKRKNGRSASRPNTIRAASASTAGTSVSSRAGPRPRPPPREKAPAITRNGATARSWNKSTAKVARPTVAPSRLPSISTGMTIAVDDMLSAAATIRAEAGARPSP